MIEQKKNMNEFEQAKEDMESARNALNEFQKKYGKEEESTEEGGSHTITFSLTKENMLEYLELTDKIGKAQKLVNEKYTDFKKSKIIKERLEK